MAGRPLSATPHPNKDGTVTVRLPAAPGSKERVSEKFPNNEVAARWRAAVLAARKVGRPDPDPDPYRAAARRRAPDELLDDFAAVAWAWWDKFYPSDGPNPERRDDIEGHIRNHLVPFFATRVDHVGEIGYADCEDFVNFMSGQRPKTPRTKPGVYEAREMTLAEAAKWCCRSKAAMRKARSSKRFPNAYLDTSVSDMGIYRIPIGDLIAAGYVPDEGTQLVPYGLSERHASALLNDLRGIFKFAMANELMSNDPSNGLKAKEPARTARVLRPGSRDHAPVYLFDLVTCKSIASRLHIHHQMTFWLLRCAGLRIGEAFGITLEDIYRDEGRMTIRLWRQGGKYYKVIAADGSIERVPSKKVLKTKTSQRVLPIAGPLAALIEVYIEAFHDGEVDLSTPLLKTPGGRGQSAFRDALSLATEAADYGESEVGFRATPKTHRTFFATDLDDIPLRPRSSYMGHKMKDLDGSAAITESTYTVKHKGVQHLLVVSDTMASRIESSIGSLVEPVPVGRLLPASLCHDVRDRERALGVLDAAGYVATAVVDGREVVEMEDAAELLKVSKHHVSNLVRQGVLERERVEGPGQNSFFAVNAMSLQAQMARIHGTWTRQRLCLEFDLAYRQVVYLIEVLGIAPLEAPYTRGFRYTDDEVDKLRHYLDARAGVSRTAASMQEVTRVLGCSRRTAHRFLTAGQLEVDEAASEVVGWTMVTRDSLEKLVVDREPRSALPRVQPEGTISIREAQERTGLGRVDVLELSAKGVLIHRTSDYRFWVDEQSLLAFTSGAR